MERSGGCLGVLAGVVISAIVFAAVLGIASVPGCKRPTEGSGKRQVVTTTAMIGDLVRNIAGDGVDVRSLMGEGTDPHGYVSTRSDVIALENADVVIANGLQLEGKMTTIFERLGSAGQPIHLLGTKLDRSLLLEIESGGDGHNHDPHIWMDVDVWTTAIDVVAEILGDDADEEKAASYRAQLAALDEYIRTSISSIPEERRVLVTAHDAFGYLGRAYGIDVRGIQGVSTESEAGARDITLLVDFIASRGIPAIFVESSVDTKSVQAIREGVRARGATLEIGGTLFSDAMGRPGTYEGTYIGMMDHNVTTITRALGGDAPAAGMQGKLTAAGATSDGE